MKREIVPKPKKMLLFYRFVVALVVVMVLILIAGSFLAVVRPAGSAPLLRIGGDTVSSREGQGFPGPEPVFSAGGETGMFSGIGRLRIPISGPRPATLILSISFPYPIHDRAFTEELASRIGEFRSIATLYFASLPLNRITNLDEDAAKAEILQQYNALLRLGRIENLFFGDLMIIE